MLSKSLFSYQAVILLAICAFRVVILLVVIILQSFFMIFGARSLCISALDGNLHALCDAIRPGQEVKQRPHCGSLNQQALRMDFS